MGLLVLGAVVSVFAVDLKIVAPAFNLKPAGAPPILPFLFITIACGAISGFHALVSSGTSSKQISKPQDALFVGYGSMLMEAVLATLVIIAVCAGIGLAYKTVDGQILKGATAWNQHYVSWAASRGLGSKVNAMVIGSANMIETLGISKTFATVLIGLFIASFAGTTLDSAARIQRYVVSELFLNLNIKFMINKYAASGFAVVSAAILAFVTGANGKGALILWPMFGAVNQLLAALTLLLLAEYLKRKGKYKYLVTAIPCGFMLIITIWAVFINEINFIKEANWLLVAINGAVLVLSIWVVIESLIVFNTKKETLP
jgi:carbon starvation protein